MQNRNSFIVSVCVLVVAILLVILSQFKPHTDIPNAPSTRAPTLFPSRTLTPSATPTLTETMIPTMTSTSTSTPDLIYPPTVLHALPIPILDTQTPEATAIDLSEPIHLQTLTPTLFPYPLPVNGASHDDIWHILRKGAK